MNERTNPKAPLVAPAAYSKRDAFRAIVEAIAGANPITGALARIYQTTHPSKAARQQAAWFDAVTARVNEHARQLDRQDDMLAPTVMLDGLPEQLVTFMIRDCPNGLADRRYEIEDLQGELLDTDPRAIEGAAYDLQALGLVRVETPIGDWRVVLVQAAYAALDPLVIGWSPTADAIDLARLMLANDTGDAAELHAGTNWPMRRFNPAFQLLVPLFPEGRQRDFWHPEYELVGVAVAEEDRANLRRLLSEAEKWQ
ncbi:hypothetical protein GCM10011390_21790 [Aureimonas endophytica]|uniref:Uncharacterized protein n=1 Tax=Aureimonas endophytica TaxID=2027858 RepID=A0A916ZKS2_9HYPH|nr:hypothetical protein [Aureimonas endophytica]GGE02549.1 hypothetical protein GCM10011390_21790 [Aureimonas endophytica]